MNGAIRETIICYDIADPKRLGRIHRCLKRQAMPFQYSVFLFVGDDRQLQRCLDELAAIMDPAHDDIRAYTLPKRGLRINMGQPTLPEGIYYGAAPSLQAPKAAEKMAAEQQQHAQQAQADQEPEPEQKAQNDQPPSSYIYL